MRILKYLALFLLTLTLVCSCSSDDGITSDDTTQTTGGDTDDGDGNDDDGDTTDDGDDDTPPADPIVGTWTLTSAITIRDDQQTPVNLTDCQKRSTFEFSADLNVTFTNITGNAGPCTTERPRTSTWENNEDGTYKVNIFTSIVTAPLTSATLGGDTLTATFQRVEVIGFENRQPIFREFLEEQTYTRVP